MHLKTLAAQFSAPKTLILCHGLGLTDVSSYVGFWVQGNPGWTQY